jgi:hypothetical protein
MGSEPAHQRATGRIAVLVRIERTVQPEVADRWSCAQKIGVFGEMSIQLGQQVFVGAFDGGMHVRHGAEQDGSLGKRRGAAGAQFQLLLWVCGYNRGLFSQQRRPTAPKAITHLRAAIGTRPASG